MLCLIRTLQLLNKKEREVLNVADSYIIMLYCVLNNLLFLVEHLYL